MPASLGLLGLCALFAVSAAISIPSNVQDFYDSIVAQGECQDKAATGFYALSDGADSKSNPIPPHSETSFAADG